MIPGDPACYRGTDVLINRYDIRDPDLLRAVEYKFTLARELELDVMPLPGKFSFGHLCAIHRHLFQDTYDWAGEIRKLDFAKRNKETGLVNRFAELSSIDKKIDAFNNFIEGNNQLKGLRKEDFIPLFAEVQARLNDIHPFREGNGRSTRIYMTHLARAAGFEFQISKVNADEWNSASHRSLIQYDPKIPGVKFSPSNVQLRAVLNGATKPAIDHAFRHESKEQAIKDFPDVKPYFDHLDGIREKAIKLSQSGSKINPNDILLSAIEHVRNKLEMERISGYQSIALDKLAEIRPEVKIDPSAIYGPTDNHKIISDVLKNTFERKGYSQADVESSVLKTTNHIDRVAEARAMTRDEDPRPRERG